MRYLKAKNIRSKLHENGFSINKSAIEFIDTKVDDFIEKLMMQWNGHHRRITIEVVSVTKLR